MLIRAGEMCESKGHDKQSQCFKGTWIFSTLKPSESSAGATRSQSLSQHQRLADKQQANSRRRRLFLLLKVISMKGCVAPDGRPQCHVVFAQRRTSLQSLERGDVKATGHLLMNREEMQAKLGRRGNHSPLQM